MAIAPFGVGDELADNVAEVVRVIRESGLPNKTYSMFTEIEGEWDEVMRVVRDATFVAEKGIRTEVVLKADIRPGFNQHDGEKGPKASMRLIESSRRAPLTRAKRKTTQWRALASMRDVPISRLYLVLGPENTRRQPVADVPARRQRGVHVLGALERMFGA